MQDNACLEQCVSGQAVCAWNGIGARVWNKYVFPLKKKQWTAKLQPTHAIPLVYLGYIMGVSLLLPWCASVTPLVHVRP